MLKHNDIGRHAAVAFAAVLTVTSAKAVAQSADGTARNDLREVESELAERRTKAAELEQERERLRVDLQKLRRQLVRLASETQAAEIVLAESEQGLEALDLEHETRVRALKRRDHALIASLGSLSRLARRSPATLLASAGTPVDTYRSVRLMGALSSGLMVEAHRIRVIIAELQKVRADLAVQQHKHRESAAALHDKRLELSRLIDEKIAIEKQLEEKRSQEQMRISRLSQEARDLRELIVRLEAIEARRRNAAAARAEAELRAKREVERLAEREQQIALVKPGEPPVPLPKPGSESAERADSGETEPAATVVKTIAIPPRHLFSEARGKLPMPAQGQIIRKFGHPDNQGQVSRGMLIETRPLAQVISPFDGSVVYAGEFRHYGLLLIISMGEGYHILLSGMSRIYGVVGQNLLAGEPIGEMGNIDAGRPKLYVELRRQGEPINPLLWIAAAKGKISG